MDKWSKLKQRLVVLMELLTSRVFEVQPDDLLEFSADFFVELQSKRDKSEIIDEKHRTDVSKLPFRIKLIPTTDASADELQASEDAPVCTVSSIESPVRQSNPDLSRESSLLAVDSSGDRPMHISPGRRRSVAAESFDPEAEDNGESVVYPKTDAQRKRISDALQSIFIFRSLDETQMNKVLDAMEEVPVQKDQIIIQQGDDGEYFYIIESGNYDVFVDKEPAGHYKGTGYFGELALMYNTPRAATIKCISGGVLWRVDRFTFRRIVLQQAFRKRQLYETWLSNVPLLKNLNFYERKNLADALVSETVEDGDWIVRQGEPGEMMYFIEEGNVQISVDAPGGGAITLKTLHKGDYFGELALILHAPRQASAKAVGKTILAALDVRSFERLMGSCLNVMLREAGQYQSELINILGEASLNSFSALARLSTISDEEATGSKEKSS